MNNYKQISLKERTLIEYLLNVQNKSVSFIAKELNRNRSTIYREIKRNKAAIIYKAKDSQFTRDINNTLSHQNKISKYNEFLRFLYVNFNPKSFSIDVCVFKAKELGIKTPTTQTVYNWIKNKQIKIKSKDLLRPRFWWKKSSKYKHYLWEISKMNSIPITYRPKNINQRKDIGHFEIDLIVSSGNSSKAIMTLVERVTRKGFAIKLENKTMKHTKEKLKELIAKENLNIKSITKDNGMEFNLLHEVTQELNVPLYTCNTYASCEKGTNENFNGLIRRYLPKKTNFTNLKDDNIIEILNEINKMPRKILNYKSAQEFYETFG
ncbi:IS30 family transposase [Mesoplasma tabanidae]|uniref:Transposase n=1 Tax=Mesoplasma tabanidae TaxID=219745 RepID=A0A2K8P5M2_9MOLU|nr:IS30 family transposase [Mesoplasma tabanidae]ATZ21440.1 transposase [Mesoplasma tabanidae]